MNDRIEALARTALIHVGDRPVPDLPFSLQLVQWLLENRSVHLPGEDEPWQVGQDLWQIDPRQFKQLIAAEDDGESLAGLAPEELGLSLLEMYLVAVRAEIDAEMPTDRA